MSKANRRRRNRVTGRSARRKRTEVAAHVAATEAARLAMKKARKRP